MLNDGFMDNYARTGLVFVSGKGARLWDGAGREYLDFASGIGVSSLGHAHPALVAAISEQAAKLIHVSNYHQSDTAAAFAAELCARTGYDAVFLCNSGAEANEAAIKIARKRGSKLDPPRSTILSLLSSFHGRTVATLAATGQEKLRLGFGPFPAGFVHIPPNELGALAAAMGEDVCALLLEPIQGEGGVLPLETAYLQGAAKLCKERGVLLIADEVQCGVGRTGSFLASALSGIEPDLVCLAKGLGGGVPIGAVLGRGESAKVLGRGEHGSTFGGNPLAAAAGRVVLAELEKPGFLASVAAKGERIMAEIRSWRHPLVKEVRGKGLMIGLVLGIKPAELKTACLERGLLVLTAGEDVLRLLPTLVIGEEEIASGLAILHEALDAMAKEASAGEARAAAGAAGGAESGEAPIPSPS